MKNWWLQLTLRDKQLASIGGIFLSVLLGYLLLFAPLQNKVIAMRGNIKRDQQLLVWMQAMDKKIQSQDQNKTHLMSNKSSAALLAVVQNAINEDTLSSHVALLQQADNDSIQLKLHEASFDESMKWLINLCRENQLTIMQADFKPNNIPGVVNAELKLQVL